jgi:hypothetical protein
MRTRPKEQFAQNAFLYLQMAIGTVGFLSTWVVNESYSHFHHKALAGSEIVGWFLFFFAAGIWRGFSFSPTVQATPFHSELELRVAADETIPPGRWGGAESVSGIVILLSVVGLLAWSNDLKSPLAGLLAFPFLGVLGPRPAAWFSFLLAPLVLVASMSPVMLGLFRHTIPMRELVLLAMLSFGTVLAIVAVVQLLSIQVFALRTSDRNAMEGVRESHLKPQLRVAMRMGLILFVVVLGLTLIHGAPPKKEEVQSNGGSKGRMVNNGLVMRPGKGGGDFDGTGAAATEGGEGVGDIGKEKRGSDGAEGEAVGNKTSSGVGHKEPQSDASEDGGDSNLAEGQGEEPIGGSSAGREKGKRFPSKFPKIPEITWKEILKKIPIPLALVAVALILYLVSRRQLRRDRSGSGDIEAAAREEMRRLAESLKQRSFTHSDLVVLYERFLLDMQRLGFARHEYETAQEYQSELERIFRGVGPALEGLTRAFEKTRYGERTISVEESVQVLSGLRAAYQLICRQAPECPKRG